METYRLGHRTVDSSREVNEMKARADGADSRCGELSAELEALRRQHAAIEAEATCAARGRARDEHAHGLSRSLNFSAVFVTLTGAHCLSVSSSRGLFFWTSKPSCCDEEAECRKAS